MAVALTDAVPAGIYARQALESAGVWEQLRPHLAETDNVRSAAVLVDRGEVPFGIVYETDAQLFQNLTIAYRIPSTGHDPIVYPIGAISGGHQSTEAYISYLMNSTSSQVFRDFGFGIAP